MAMRPLSAWGPLPGNVGINLCGLGDRGWTLNFGWSQGEVRIRTFSLQTRRPNWESLGSCGVSDFKCILFSLGMACPAAQTPLSKTCGGLGNWMEWLGVSRRWRWATHYARSILWGPCGPTCGAPRFWIVVSMGR